MWSPDGDQIVFTSNRDGPPNLYLRSADGTGDVERLTTSLESNLSYAWSADGGTVLFGAGRDLYRLELEGERASARLFETPFAEFNAALSPAGRWLAYQSNEGGDRDVYVRPFPDVDGGLWKVSAAGGAYPVWSAGGDELYFLSGDAVMATTITAGSTFNWDNPTVLFRGPYALSGEVFRRVFDVSPEGRFLMRKLAGAGAGEGPAAPELVAVFNWTAELAELVPLN